jgi:hypothetical protein
MFRAWFLQVSFCYNNGTSGLPHLEDGQQQQQSGSTPPPFTKSYALLCATESTMAFKRCGAVLGPIWPHPGVVDENDKSWITGS